jgi:Tetratrico peptide repeat
MSEIGNDWEARVARLWQQVDGMAPEAFVAAIDALAAECPAGDAAALFERASARDTVGLESGAERLYRAALATKGLDPYRGARATIQLASTLRILGELDESERLLATELGRRSKAGGEHVLHDELRATLALTYVAQGRAVEGAGLALLTLAPHLSRYNRSVSGNAAELIEKAAAGRIDANPARSQ